MDAIVWHLSPPEDGEARLQAMQVGLQAPIVLGVVLHALQLHPTQRISIVADPSYLAALRDSTAGETALRPGLREGDRLRALRVLASSVPEDQQLQRTPAARRYGALADAARIVLAGGRGVHFSTDDLSDFGSFDALLHLAASGFIPRASPLLRKRSLSAQDRRSIADMLQQADQALYAQLQDQIRRHALEVIADPAYEPVLPLLVDAGGKTALEAADSHVVVIDARADAERSIVDGLKAVAALTGHDQHVGLYSPFGAYDDATAELLQRTHVGFALFSDRVLQAAEAGGSAEAAQSARIAPYHEFAIQTDKATKLTAYFWDENESIALNNLALDLPVTALGRRVVDFSRAVLQETSGEDGVHVVVLRIDADGLWAQRPDAGAVVERLFAALDSAGELQTATAGGLAGSKIAARTAYGYAANSSLGSFDLWMGSANQASLWHALVDARKAAGGEAALAKDATREPLLRSEAGRWFALPASPQSAFAIMRTLDGFRENIMALYRAAKLSPPARIAPLSANLPVPVPAR